MRSRHLHQQEALAGSRPRRATVWLAALISAPLSASSAPPAAEQGQTLYAEGRHAAAIPWLKKSAQGGDAESQYLLGILCSNGDGLKADRQAAAHWFQLAADHGHRAAQYELGAMYQYGEGGLPKDDRRAIALYALSARQGFEPANLILGVDYELGDGIPRSRSQALRYFQQAGPEGLFMAGALTAADTPSRLDGALALGNYLARVPDSPISAEWTQDPAARRAGEPSTLVAILNSKRYQRPKD